jgi:hypothetical protein
MRQLMKLPVPELAGSATTPRFSFSIWLSGVFCAPAMQAADAQIVIA